MKIEGLENITTMFSVFHDGGFANCVQHGQSLNFSVNIQYLADRINLSYRAFSVSLEAVEYLSFTTWPDDAAAKLYWFAIDSTYGNLYDKDCKWNTTTS